MNLDVLVISRAAAFCTGCNLLILVDHRANYYSNLIFPW